MSKLTDRASYLKGLAAGMKLNMEKDSNKLLTEALNVIQEITEEMERIASAHEELNEYVESIDEDLAEIEETLFGEADSDEDDEEDCGCGHCHDDDDDDDDDDDETISYECPSCGHEILFKASSVDFDENYLCPACGKPVFPEMEQDDASSKPADGGDEYSEE